MFRGFTFHQLGSGSLTLESCSNILSFVFSFANFTRLQRARASKNVKNLSQPKDVLKFRETQAAFFEANVLVTDKPKSYPRMREVCRCIVAESAALRAAHKARRVQDRAAYAAEVYSFQKGL